MKINKTFSLDSDLVKKIEWLAEKDNRTLSSYVNNLLCECIKQLETKEPSKEGYY